MPLPISVHFSVGASSISLLALLVMVGCGSSSEPASTNTTATVSTTTADSTATGAPMVSTSTSPPYSTTFELAADTRLRHQGTDLADACNSTDPTTRKILVAYGSAFVAAAAVRVPPTCIFISDAAVLAFQDDPDLEVRAEVIGGVAIELQALAMDALIEAINAARAVGLDITPNGSDAARRDFPTTERLWTSRVDPALDHWQALGRISSDDAARIRALTPVEQVPEVLALESQGIWFNTQFERTILSSVAAPGTSQHLSMLAVDLTQANDQSVQEIMADHGWFQTVLDDRFHFTYLGVAEAELPGLGLVLIENPEHRYWVPGLD